MKQSFFLQVLSENGNPSSKRVICFILLLFYGIVLFYNMITGKAPSDTIENQLYYMLVTNMGIILGSNIIDAVKEVKVTQSNNNATAGLASPTQPATPVVVTPVVAPVVAPSAPIQQ